MRPKNEPGLPNFYGDSLRLRRLFHRMSLEELAEKVGVAPSTIHRWERDTNRPTAVYVTLLAEALDVPRTVFAREPKLK